MAGAGRRSFFIFFFSMKRIREISDSDDNATKRSKPDENEEEEEEEGPLATFPEDLVDEIAAADPLGVLPVMLYLNRHLSHVFTGFENGRAWQTLYKHWTKGLLGYSEYRGTFENMTWRKLCKWFIHDRLPARPYLMIAWPIVDCCETWLSVDDKLECRSCGTALWKPGFGDHWIPARKLDTTRFKEWREQRKDINDLRTTPGGTIEFELGDIEPQIGDYMIPHYRYTMPCYWDPNHPTEIVCPSIKRDVLLRNVHNDAIIAMTKEKIPPEYEGRIAYFIGLY